MQTLLEIGLANALAATLLAAAALVAGRVCRHPTVVHGLWLLVLVKLVTPPLVWVSLPWGPAATTSTLPALPSSEAVETTGPAPLDRAALTAQLRSLEDAATAPDQPRPALNLVDVGGMLWLGGAALWLAWTASQLARFRRLLRHVGAASPELQARAEELARRMGLRGAPVVLLIPGQLSPMVWSFLGRPRLLFPAGLLERISPAQRDTLILHELAHLARRDHWVRWLEVAASGLYWWFPVVWLARRALHAAEEECCDAWVTRALPHAGRDYALALVQTVSFLSPACARLPVAASGIGPVPQLKRRLTMILRGPSSSIRSRRGGVAVLALALVLLPWAPSLAQHPKDQPAAARALRQRQIEVLRQLLKSLEQEQQAEMRVLGVVDGVNRDELVQVVVGSDKRSLPVATPQKVQIISDGSGRAELPVIGGTNKSDRPTVVEKKAPDKAKQESPDPNVRAGARDLLSDLVALELIKKQAVRAEAARALGLLAGADEAQAREAQKIRLEIEQAKAQIRMAAVKLEQLQEALDRLSKGNPDAGAAPAGPGHLVVFRMRSTPAADVAKALDEALNGPQRPGAPRPERVRIVAEPVTNALLIAATPADLELIRKLLESLDPEVRK